MDAGVSTAWRGEAGVHGGHGAEGETACEGQLNSTWFRLARGGVSIEKALDLKTKFCLGHSGAGSPGRVEGKVEEAAVVRKQFLEKIKVLLRHVENFQDTVLLLLLLLLPLIFWKVGREHPQF